MEKQVTGKIGESLAIDWLLSHGMKVLHTNWRHSRYEVDIICTDSLRVIFVEVKTRSTDWFNQPEDSIGQSKMNSMTEAALAYINQNNIQGNIRFDVISLIIRPFEKKLLHQKDAFFPF